MAPIRPTIAINNRNTPHAMMPPKTDTVAMIATAFPYAATPISVIAIAYNYIFIQTQNGFQTLQNRITKMLSQFPIDLCSENCAYDLIFTFREGFNWCIIYATTLLCSTHPIFFKTISCGRN